MEDKDEDRITGILMLIDDDYALGDYGVQITWQSSKPEYIAEDGTVTRPSQGELDEEVLLTAYFTRNTQVLPGSFAYSSGRGESAG